MLTNCPDPADVTARPVFYRLCVRSTHISAHYLCSDDAVQWVEPIRGMNAVWKFRMHPHTLQVE